MNTRKIKVKKKKKKKKHKARPVKEETKNGHNWEGDPRGARRRKLGDWQEKKSRYCLSWQVQRGRKNPLCYGRLHTNRSGRTFGEGQDTHENKLVGTGPKGEIFCDEKKQFPLGVYEKKDRTQGGRRKEGCYQKEDVEKKGWEKVSIRGRRARQNGPEKRKGGP